MKCDTIYSRFLRQVEARPDHTAIITAAENITYAGLQARVCAIAERIGPHPGRFIGIVMSHGINQIAAMLAVLKSGAAYIPAEPSLPPDRIGYMMRRAGVRLVIDDDFCAGLHDTVPDTRDRSTPDSIAYVLYTSGTTGHPKGVKVKNYSVVNYADAFQSEFHTGPSDVMLQYSVCSFDIFVEEVFTTLLNGATLAIAPRELTGEGSTLPLMEFVERHGVTMISGFPYLLAEINRTVTTLPSRLRLLISGGDVLRASYIDRLRDKGVMIYNTYGPSETTVCATYYRCDNASALADGTFPIGRAIKGVGVTVMDELGNECNPGEIGEICITGLGVSDGYIGNPPEQGNFVTLDDGDRMYRSGDMGYWLPDGNLAFMRRRDDQVMIMGKRVEPEEVENVLNASPEVDRGIVRAFTDDTGLAYLVAYFVPAEAGYSLRDIKRRMRSTLTDFMIPEFFVAVKGIPINKRGKVDITALPIVLKEGADL